MKLPQRHDRRTAHPTSARATRSSRAQLPGPELCHREAGADEQPGPLAATSSQPCSGPRITADTGEWGTFAWTQFLLGGPGMRVAGGTDEVMKNIVAERGAGAADRTPGIDSKTPFRELRTNLRLVGPGSPGARPPGGRRATCASPSSATVSRRGPVAGRSVDDPDLTDRGRRQAELLADHIADLSCDEVLVSPLTRARQTAAPLLEILGHEAGDAPWLAEIAAPPWEGAPEEQVTRTFAEGRARPVDEQWDGIPGGETFRAFHERVTGGLTQVLAERGARPVGPGLTALGDRGARAPRRLRRPRRTNAVAIGHLLGIDPVPVGVGALRDAPLLGERARPLRDRRQLRFSLLRLNDVEHLPDDLRTR
jgi:hypothetical protein